MIPPFKETSCGRCQGGSQPPIIPRESFQLVPAGTKLCMTHSFPVKVEWLLFSNLAGPLQPKETNSRSLGSVSLQQIEIFLLLYFSVYTCRQMPRMCLPCFCRVWFEAFLGSPQCQISNLISCCHWRRGP